MLGDAYKSTARPQLDFKAKIELSRLEDAQRDKREEVQRTKRTAKQGKNNTAVVSEVPKAKRRSSIAQRRDDEKENEPSPQ